MKNTIKVFGIITLVAVMVLALAFTACEQPTTSGGGVPTPTTITYTAEQDGGIDGTADSTGIVFTFSASVDSLTADDITVSGAAAKGTGALTGSGTSWTLPITVNAAGLATVSIAKDGIEAAAKSVIVHKEGQATPEYWSVTWNLNGGEKGTGAYPTQIVKGAVLAKPSPDPTKANSTFGGWYTNSSLSQTYNFANAVTANLNLYAKWETGSQPPDPAHTHQWGAWTATTIEGTEQRVCGTDQSHIEHRLTGTDRFNFELITGTSYRVSKGTVTTGEVYIPAYYRPNNNSEYLPVTEIGSASDNNSSVGAFVWCTDLTAVIIPATVTSIGGFAFFNCENITNIIIPASVTYIGDRAFSSCSKLTSITIPEGVTAIGSGTFNGCTGLTAITIPECVTSLGNNAFSGCTGLTSITIPAGVTSIGNNAFWGCTGLIGITVDANNSHYVSQDRILYDKAKTEFISIPKGISGSVTIPAGITAIGNQAFRDCTSLVTVTFAEGSQLNTIGYQAFSGCTSLTSITLPASLTSIDDFVFENCASLVGITVDGNNSHYASEGGILYNKAKTTILIIPLGITGSVTIPASVTTIDDFTFSACTGLTGITVDNGNPNYASEGGILYNKTKTVLIQAPRGISGAVTLPTGVTTIGNNAFWGYTGLTGITIPASVTTIGYSVFYGCTSLVTVTFAEGSQLESIDNGAFAGCTSLTGITIPASVTTIGGAFNGCTSLVTVTFAEGSQLESIGDIAFNDCTSLTAITIPAGVTTIGYSAFYGCTSLTAITIPASVTSIDYWAFYDWTALQTIYIQGHASQAAADTAWGVNWRGGCNAVIKYWNGSEYQ